MDASADRKSNEINVTMEEPIRILMLFTIMNRGGAETMVMNYYRHIDRNRVQLIDILRILPHILLHLVQLAAVHRFFGSL